MHEQGKSFGQLLRRFREESSLSQESLAERSGLSARAIGNLERGRSRPRADSLQRIVSALGLEGARARAMVEAGTGNPPARPSHEQPLSDPEVLLVLETVGGVDPHSWEPAVRTALIRACSGSAAAARLVGAVLAVEPDLRLADLAHRLDSLAATC
ncbi:helix-turn-helix domain-containing protein [Kitasatospora sp. NPDC088391]|uniref:helix-turn-helix domain-containing protein n=1 Tax=Kitasatospora sp. NPDC088391 TaxID=3364074 RepID=UPI00382016EC